MYRLCGHAWLIFVDFLLHGDRKVLKIVAKRFLEAKNSTIFIKIIYEHQQNSYKKNYQKFYA